MGLVLVVLALNHIKNKQKDEKQKDEKQKHKKRGAYIAMGAGLGLILGVALNKCGLWENDLNGLAFGPLWGMFLAIASLSSQKDKKDKEE